MLTLPQTAEYALRAVLHLAARGDRFERVSDIAAALEVPRNYLSKTLHLLVRVGVLASTRGPHGGFHLAVAPDRLMLVTVVSPFEPVGRHACLLGSAVCGDAAPCQAHDRWRRAWAGLEDFFAETSVAELLQASTLLGGNHDST